MDVHNDLTIEVYSSGTTRVVTDDATLKRAQAIMFDTFYPGGLFGSATVYVPFDILRYWTYQGAKRIIVRNGMDIIWEGEIDQLSGQVAGDGEGMLLTALGFWGSKLMRRRIHRLYVDRRTSEASWRFVEAPGTLDKFSLSRRDDLGDVILFTPSNKAVTNTDLIEVNYYAPTGEGIKKIMFDYDYTEKAGEDFKIGIYDITGGAAASETGVSGAAGEQTWTGAAAGATTQVAMRLTSNANQTATGDGQTYGEFADIRVYAWTSNTGNFAATMDAIAKDLVADFTTVFNSDVTHITTPGSPYTLTGFLAEWDTLADILTDATGHGDGATPPNAYAVYLDHSEKAATPNGLPVLYLEAWPTLTSFDYGINLTGENVIAPVSITKDYTTIANWIIVQYSDSGGVVSYKTPDDDANLKDTTSITNYGQRDTILLVGETDSTTAIQLGKRYLAQWKDPKYIIDGPINVQQYIYDNYGQPIPACRVRAGKRIRILDYLDDLSGTGLTMVISATSYNADTETVSIQTGILTENDMAMEQLEDYVAPRDFAPKEQPSPPKKRKKKKRKRSLRSEVI